MVDIDKLFDLNVGFSNENFESDKQVHSYKCLLSSLSQDVKDLQDCQCEILSAANHPYVYEASRPLRRHRVSTFGKVTKKL